MGYKLTQGQIEEACALRETRGLIGEQIVRRLRLPIVPNTLQWHFLVRGAEKPGASPRPNFYKGAGETYLRGAFAVRRFTREEDALIQALSIEGKNPTQIGRALDPPRKANSIRGRLATLARQEERLEQSGQST